MLCLRLPFESSNEILALNLADYPGAGKTLETRHYGFTGIMRPEFQFSTTISSVFECNQVKNPKTLHSGIELRSTLNPEGVFWSEGFNGSFCCHAISGKIRKQWSDECALMRISDVSTNFFHVKNGRSLISAVVYTEIRVRQSDFSPRERLDINLK